MDEDQPQNVEVNQNIAHLMQDRVYQALKESCVVLEDFTELPSVRNYNGQLFFLTPKQQGSKRSLTDVVDSRQDYYSLRLALAEERVFSHTDRFQRAKLNNGAKTIAGQQ